MTIFLGPGDYFFGSTSEQISTLLGSCVSLVAWLPERQLLSVSHVMLPKEGANKQVISSQADSLIKISRIWADFVLVATSNLFINFHGLALLFVQQLQSPSW